MHVKYEIYIAQEHAKRVKCLQSYGFSLLLSMMNSCISVQLSLKQNHLVMSLDILPKMYTKYNNLSINTNQYKHKALY